MPKVILAAVMILFVALTVALGEAAETSRVALAIVVTIFAIALSVPAALGVALVVERRRPQVTHHHYHDNRRIVIVPPVDPTAQVSEPERGLTIR